jgi:hypothetical protein
MSVENIMIMTIASIYFNKKFNKKEHKICYDLLIHYVKNIKIVADNYFINMRIKYDDTEYSCDYILILNCILLNQNKEYDDYLEKILKKKIIFDIKEISYTDCGKQRIHQMLLNCEFFNEKLFMILLKNKSFYDFYETEIHEGFTKSSFKFHVENHKKYKIITNTISFMEMQLKKRNIKLFKFYFIRNKKHYSELKNSSGKNLLEISISQTGLVQNFVKLLLDSKLFNKIKKSDIKNKKVRELFHDLYKN